jgi:tetratricopeptide (TPR) repeat protein
MKRIVFALLITLALAACFPAQQKPEPSGAADLRNNRGGPPAWQNPAPPSPPVAKKTAQAKTQAEYKDYNAAYGITGGPEMEKAADEFAAKYPDSELKAFLYSKAVHEYQSENNLDKMLAVGEKVLQLDPDNTVTLVLTATVLSDDLSPDDPNRAKKAEEIKQRAQRAIRTVDSSFAPPANATPEQITTYKDRLMSMAHSALGIAYLKTRDDAGAEKELKAAAEIGRATPDAFVWYHLALAQDHQDKTAEALASVDQALRYAPSNTELAKLAASERERLVMIMKPAGSSTPLGSPPQAQPSPTPH